jgi:hypothetical protein
MWQADQCCGAAKRTSGTVRQFFLSMNVPSEGILAEI